MIKSNYRPGLDIARIVAIYLVIVLHVLTAFDGMREGLLCKLMIAVSVCSVDLFGLISGYLGVTAKCFKLKRIAELWLQVFFTGVVVTGLWYLLPFEQPTLKDWGKALLPISSHEYWYFTAYFMLALFMPVLNAGMNACPRKTLAMLAGALFLFVVMIPSFNPYVSDTYTLGNGYSPIWLMVLYFFGGCLRLLLSDRRWFLLGGGG